jgi:hypothetical protein
MIFSPIMHKLVPYTLLQTILENYCQAAGRNLTADFDG